MRTLGRKRQTIKPSNVHLYGYKESAQRNLYGILYRWYHRLEKLYFPRNLYGIKIQTLQTFTNLISTVLGFICKFVYE